jgi:hypothetical protein
MEALYALGVLFVNGCRAPKYDISESICVICVIYGERFGSF